MTLGGSLTSGSTRSVGIWPRLSAGGIGVSSAIGVSLVSTGELVTQLLALDDVTSNLLKRLHPSLRTEQLLGAIGGSKLGDRQNLKGPQCVAELREELRRGALEVGRRQHEIGQRRIIVWHFIKRWARVDEPPARLTVGYFLPGPPGGTSGDGGGTSPGVTGLGTMTRPMPGYCTTTNGGATMG